MLVKAKGYGYRNLGFILDRGYFSRDNIRFLVIQLLWNLNAHPRICMIQRTKRVRLTFPVTKAKKTSIPI